MGGLTNSRRIELERFLMTQTPKPRYILSAEYLEKFPKNKNKTHVFVNDIVKNKRPGTQVWYTRHVLERQGDNSLTKEEINATLARGHYLPSRNRYVNNKLGVVATNRGHIAPAFAMTKNKKPIKCPTRRLVDGNKTVVLSFCYPRAFTQSRFRPTVVTAYRRNRRH